MKHPSASHYFRCSILIAVALYLLNACTPPSSPNAAEVLALHHNKFKWMAAADTASLAQLLSDDVQYIHSNGWVERKEELLQNLHNGTLSYEGVTVHSAELRTYQHTAIVTGLGTFEVALHGQPLSIDLSYTEVYVLKEDAWKLVSRHACKPSSAEAKPS